MEMTNNFLETIPNQIYHKRKFFISVLQLLLLVLKIAIIWEFG